MEPPQGSLPSYTGMSPYELPCDLPLPQSRAASQRQSSHYSGAKEGSIFQGGEGSLRDPSLRSRRSSTSMIKTGDRQSVRGQRAVRRVDEEQSGWRIPEVNSRGETVYHTPTDSVASTERLPDEEYVNGILRGGSPSPSPVPSFPTPNTPPADHPDNHRTGPLPPVDR